MEICCHFSSQTLMDITYTTIEVYMLLTLLQCGDKPIHVRDEIEDYFQIVQTDTVSHNRLCTLHASVYVFISRVTSGLKLTRVFRRASHV